MKFFNVILYDTNGCEIASSEQQGMKAAKEHAKHFLSDSFAETSETTHANLGTMKVAIFADGDKTGANVLCEWDKFHPQHAKREAALGVEFTPGCELAEMNEMDAKHPGWDSP